VVVVLIVGAGRAGGHVAERLAHAGQRSFCIIDHDLLEPENVPHHVLTSARVGAPKAEGLAQYLAERYDANVQYAVVGFGFRLLEPGNPVSHMIYGQDLILGLTDDQAVQRALAVTAANLEIPFIAAGVAADGSGEVFAQLDVDRDTCYGCFTQHRHRAPNTSNGLRGRDLRAGAGANVDRWVTTLTRALLDPSSAEANTVFAPHRRVGVRTAWHVPADPSSEPEPMAVERNRACPVCGDVARRARRPTPVPNPPSAPVPSAPARPTDLLEAAFTAVSVIMSLIVAGLAGLVWTWFWSADFKFMANPIIWIGLIVGGVGLVGFLDDLRE
jgi:molybdopterin/thiamine biosynthesis adenylyltransferase